MSVRPRTFRRPAWRLSLVCALALASLAPVAAQGQWKWRDGGRVQYSDRPPPPSVSDKDIIARPAGATRPALAAPTAAPAASAASAADPRLEARKREADQKAKEEQKAKEAELARVRRENCEQARAYVRTLESGMRVARVNDRGEREVMTDQQRSGEVNRAQQVIASECK
jgi:hypothetical protein